MREDVTRGREGGREGKSRQDRENVSEIERKRSIWDLKG